jgi:hypothetical protein
MIEGSRQVPTRNIKQLKSGLEYVKAAEPRPPNGTLQPNMQETKHQLPGLCVS